MLLILKTMLCSFCMTSRPATNQTSVCGCTLTVLQVQVDLVSWLTLDSVFQIEFLYCPPVTLWTGKHCANIVQTSKNISVLHKFGKSAKISGTLHARSDWEETPEHMNLVASSVNTHLRPEKLMFYTWWLQNPSCHRQQSNTNSVLFYSKKKKSGCRFHLSRCVHLTALGVCVCVSWLPGRPVYNYFLQLSRESLTLAGLRVWFLLAVQKS